MNNFAIGMVYDGRWNIYYGPASKVQDYIITRFDGAVINKYHTEERMEKQLEYYRQELTNPIIEKISV